jgi:cohesin loading factor subunit SCC2
MLIRNSKFKFAASPSTSKAHTGEIAQKLKLSPFAQRLYDGTEVPFRSVPQQTSEVPSTNGTAPHRTPKQAAQRIVKRKTTTIKSPNITRNDQAHSLNSNFEVRIPQYEPSPPSNSYPNGTQTPQNKPPPYQTSYSNGTNISVVLPQASEVVKTEEYIKYPNEPSTPENYTTRKRKRSNTLDDEDTPGQGSIQREKVDESYRSLQKLMQEIFEADDDFEVQDTIDRSGSSYFITLDRDVFSLASDVQAELEKHLSKLLSSVRFADIPVDHLLRLQKLSQGSISAAKDVSLTFQNSWEEIDVEEWVVMLKAAVSGLKSARIALRLMTGGREEKTLYSEDIIMISLQALSNVLNACIIPIVEMRSSGSASKLFKILSVRKKEILSVLSQCNQLLALLKELVAKVELSETVINALEDTVSNLIFVDNAHVEKESILGIQKFDTFRIVAMDVLGQIFLTYPSQRAGIFNEILTSLEKLPVSKQSARQFRLVEGGSIQLVSALIMRLIQTSFNKSDTGRRDRRGRALGPDIDDDSNDANHEESKDAADIVALGSVRDTEDRAIRQSVTSIQELRDVVSPLKDMAWTNAKYVVGFIVDRATNSTKSGDTPFRNLFDLFVQDFVKCLSSMDWPGAEILLFAVMVKMVALAEGEKTPAPAKNMALDVLSEVGAAIALINSQIRMPTGSLEVPDADSELLHHLLHLAEAQLGTNTRPVDLIGWEGPFRGVLESLYQRSVTDTSLRGALGCFIATWASRVVDTYDLIDDDDPDHKKTEAEYGRVAYRLRKMITDNDWIHIEHHPQPLSIPHARLAYHLTLKTSKVCKALERIFIILLNSMRSEQATVRSKGLRSITQMLDTDQTILDRVPAVLRTIEDCSKDSSVQVRETALGLIGKCIELKPSLEGDMIIFILERVSDTGAGVRKRAVRLLKDIYLRNHQKDVRTRIADALIQRVNDRDESVQGLARQVIEEVWMHPHYRRGAAPDDTSVQYRLAMTEQVSLMVKTMQRSKSLMNGLDKAPDATIVFDKVLRSLLSDASKCPDENFRVCQNLVATMFETIIDNSNGESNDAREALELLEIFAKAKPQLFTTQQVQLLPPYLADLSRPARFRCVVNIFRHVFPELSNAPLSLFDKVRRELMLKISRANTPLDETVACLWVISKMLRNSEPLAKTAVSSLKRCSESYEVGNFGDASQQQKLRQLERLLLISGVLGKHCDLEDQIIHFKALPKWKDKKTVSRLMVDTFDPFASPSQPTQLRKAALEAIGMVCQSWPKNFSSPNISARFQEVFNERSPILEGAILESFKEFLLSEEKKSEPGAEVLVGASMDTPATLGVMGGSQHDGVAIEIAQKFLKDIIRIALATYDEHALLATKILITINRQGINHPKESGPALVALETSPNAEIANSAFVEHRSLHEKHETILEKEYMRAVQSAFHYQRDVVKDSHGAIPNPFTSKLHFMMDVLKTSTVKARKRFLQNLCTRIDFDPAKIPNLDVSGMLQDHIDFSRFIIENMAFFEYQSIDELLHTLSAMERMVAGTGTTIAHAVETEIFQVRVEQDSDQMLLDGQELSRPTEASVNPSRLRQLAAASMVLSAVWETRTYLRRAYGLVGLRKDGIKKTAVKDLNKVPVKVQGTTGDKFWDEIANIMSALNSPDSMMHQCKSFVETLNIDRDFKLAADGEDDVLEGRNTTPDGDNDAPTPGSGRGRKRNGTSSTPSRKKRPRSSSRGRSKKTSRSTDSDEDAEGDWE